METIGFRGGDSTINHCETQQQEAVCHILLYSLQEVFRYDMQHSEQHDEIKHQRWKRSRRDARTIPRNEQAWAIQNLKGQRETERVMMSSKIPHTTCQFTREVEKNVNCIHVCLFVFQFYVPPTNKFIWRRSVDLKSHPKDWRSWESNLRSLVYMASDHYTMVDPTYTCVHAFIKWV